MIDDDPSLPPPKPLDSSARRSGGKWIALLVIILVLIAGAFGGIGALFGYDIDVLVTPDPLKKGRLAL